MGGMHRSHSADHQVRIIGGDFKRTPLTVLDRPGLRPTPDRVRETLFNWLGQDLRGWRCLDAFAGTGALGFEAASRGAASVRMMESDARTFAQLEQVRNKLGATAVQLVRGDALVQLAHAAPATFDVVFLDPPFDSELFDPALLAAGRAVADTGWVYLEAPRHWPDERIAAAGLVVHRYLKAGAVHAHLMRRKMGSAGS